MFKPMQLAKALCLALFLSPMLLSAQQSQLGIHLGLSNYLGDIVPQSISFGNAQLSYGAFYRYDMSEKISIRANVMLGQLKANDSDYEERGTRGFSFETNYTEIGGMVEYNLNGKPRYDEMGVFQKNNTFYLLAGISALLLNPEAAGLPADAPERAEDYSTFAFAVPVGLGVKLPLSEDITLGVEVGARIAFSDYLDGISESAGPDRTDNMGHFEVNVAYHFNKDKSDDE